MGQLGQLKTVLNSKSKTSKTFLFLVYHPFSSKRLGCHEYVTGCSYTGFVQVLPVFNLGESPKYDPLQVPCSYRQKITAHSKQYPVLRHGIVWTQAVPTSGLSSPTDVIQNCILKVCMLICFATFATNVH